jgi:Ca2+-transporting ATPase
MSSNVPDRGWHTLSSEEAVRRLRTDAKSGLEPDDAAQRLIRYGPNDIEAEEQRSLASILLSQVSDVMILILAAAAIVSGLLGEIADAIAIVAIVVLNALIGAAQEFRAQRAVAALRRMSAPEALIARNGKSLVVPAATLVPGDIVLLEAGNVAAADLRLLECQELATDESALTGESVPVAKTVAALDGDDLPVSDRRNMVYKSTSVTRGRGRGVVVATGLGTEIGRIAGLLAKRRGLRTPLQQRLAIFGKRLAFVVLAICALVFALGLASGEPPLLMFLTAVSLAVAAIPEALPAVVTVSLALGARKLAKEQSLVRRLPAVETLGSVTFICSDKTGTLTQNRMTLAAIFAADRLHERLGAIGGPVRKQLATALSLCNEVIDEGIGDPTERALVDAAAREGFDRRAMLTRMPMIAELAFESQRKLMSTVHRRESDVIAYVKGAPERVIARCTSELDATGRKGAIDAEARLATAEALAGQGYRVLAVASRELSDIPDAIEAEAIERDLTLLGLVALHDPIRPEVPAAIADCRTAGITPVMITGDHPVTAQQIAARLELSAEGATMSGTELAALTDAALRDRAPHTRVFARVNPEQKIRIVEALQADGEHVAMTGDGVNDAPALKQASIGVAMGQRGTDVAREAADMVLLDDNFATIVTAIREGRRVYDNIRKFIKYTMTSNAGEIWVLLLAPFFALPIPLLPIHILWVNLVTDGLPGLAFSAEPAEPNVMRRPPRPPTESIFAGGMWPHILWVGLLIGGLSLGTSAWVDTGNLTHWQTMVFTTLVTSQLFQALALRSETESLFRLGVFTNPYMISTVAATLIVQLLAIYLPVLNAMLNTVPLALTDLLVCLALGFFVLPAVELQKWLVRRRPGS